MATPAERDLRPFVVAVVVAVVSVALLWLAVVQGWLGPDVGRGDRFCEAARDALVRQPANTFSNAGFVVAGLAIGWRAGAPARRSRRTHGSRQASAWSSCCSVRPARRCTRRRARSGATSTC